MAERGPRRAGRIVDLIEDVNLATRVFRRGTRGLGDPCRLILALNGDETLRLDEEDAGDRAPAELVIDLRMPDDAGRRILRAFSARPWALTYHPVIAYAEPDARQDGVPPIGYLVRTPLVDRVLATIRGELDLPDPDAAATALASEPQRALDATGRAG